MLGLNIEPDTIAAHKDGENFTPDELAKIEEVQKAAACSQTKGLILWTYEELQIQNADLNMKEMDLSEVSGLKGLYYNGNIAIEKKLTQNQKACVLAEELGHHYTTVGNILDQSDTGSMKQERKARLWAYNKLNRTLRYHPGI